MLEGDWEWELVPVPPASDARIRAMASQIKAASEGRNEDAIEELYYAISRLSKLDQSRLSDLTGNRKEAHVVRH